MALADPGIFASAIMLDAIPQLTGEIQVTTVPVVFVGERRYDGPMNEWILAQQVRLASEV